MVRTIVEYFRFLFIARNWQSDLEQALATADYLQSTVRDFAWALYLTEIFALMLSFLICVFLLGAYCRFPRILRCLNNVFFVPIFVVFVVISWVCSMVFVIGSMTLADFCVDSPDDNVLSILDSNRHLFSSVVYSGVVFYVSGTTFCLLDGDYASVAAHFPPPPFFFPFVSRLP